MFKFMKSKKGFSLVELMIVVVIMAILVAVAVPIFNSVTGSSRAKTCIDNQRSIISSLNTALLGKTLPAAYTAQAPFTFDVVNNKTNGKTYTGAHIEIAADANGYLINKTDLADIFQTVPYCPVDGSVIRVDITPTANGTCAITTTCENSSGNTEKDPHILGS